MKLIPHERALVARHTDKPFALVGVNGDGTREQVAATLAKEGITWRSFKNQRPGRPKISADWNVEGWPTLYLIDHQGVIRERWIGAPLAEELDRAIDELVEAAARRK
jgi:hypothetical protein